MNISITKNNKYSLVPKDDEKDRIELEIGDTKQTEFYPQKKLMRWDNEVNVSVRLVHNEKQPEISQDNDGVHWVGEKVEAHFYEIDACEEHKEGASEVEIVLKEKPDTNIIEFTLDDKGVEYFYQGELTQEQKDRGATRPDNVIGSYAIYTAEKKTNYEGGKLYKTGKVGHIYRPKIIDAEGTEVWGDLHIENGILSVTIPQDFLDNAVYPVRHAAGLTIGYTSIGGSGDSASGYFVGSKFQATSGGNANPGTMYAYISSTGSSTFGLGVYDNSATPPNGNALLATANITFNNSSYSWQNTAITWTGITLNNYYYLCFSATGTCGIAWDGTQTSYYQGYSYSGTMPATCPNLSISQNELFSLYVVYSSGSPLLDKFSATDLGFLDNTNALDFDPFDSGDQIAYTVQITEALSPGTYYWRVRGKDPSGSNTYGAWSSIRSFTVTSGGGTDYPLTCQFSNSAITPKTVVFTITRTLATSVSNIAITPKNANVFKGYVLSTSVTNSAITAKNTIFTRGYTLAASVANSTITAKTVIFSIARKFTTAVSNSAITAKNTIFSIGYTLTASVSNSAITPKTATLTYSGGYTPVNYTLTCSVSNSAITAKTVTFTRSYTLSASVANSAVTAKTVNLSRGYKLTTSVANSAITGINSILSRGYTLTASVANSAITGIGATFHKTLHLFCSVTNSAITGKTANLNYANAIPDAFKKIFLANKQKVAIYVKTVNGFPIYIEL